MFKLMAYRVKSPSAKGRIKKILISIFQTKKIALIACTKHSYFENKYWE
jgi:hypothetical protein